MISSCLPTVVLNLNLSLNLNLNSLLFLPLLPVLPSHPCRHWCAWLSVVWVGKKIGCFFKIGRTARNAFGPWLNGGPVSTYATTTRGLDMSVSPPGPSHPTLQNHLRKEQLHDIKQSVQRKCTSVGQTQQTDKGATVG
jgi:hypothetical protein